MSRINNTDFGLYVALIDTQVVPLRTQCASLCKEQGCGSDEAWALLHHRADDLRGGECLVFALVESSAHSLPVKGLGRPDLA